MIQKLRITLQQQEQKREEREMAQSLKYWKQLYPYTLLTEEERAHEMLEMLRLDIARVIRESDELPTTMVDCFGSALCAKHCLAQIQAEKAKKKEVSKHQSKKKNNPSTSKITRSQGKKKKLTIASCRDHTGECMYSANKCYRCGQEGHFVQHCVSKHGEGSRQDTEVGIEGNDRET